jgi:hypothetical protein
VIAFTRLETLRDSGPCGAVESEKRASEAERSNASRPVAQQDRRLSAPGEIGGNSAMFEVQRLGRSGKALSAKLRTVAVLRLSSVDEQSGWVASPASSVTCARRPAPLRAPRASRRASAALGLLRFLGFVRLFADLLPRLGTVRSHQPVDGARPGLQRLAIDPRSGVIRRHHMYEDGRLYGL